MFLLKSFNIREHDQDYSESVKGKASSKEKVNRIVLFRTLFIILVTSLIALLAFVGYKIENGNVFDLKIGQIDANTRTTNGYYTGYITSSTTTPFVGILESGVHGSENVIGNEIFALMDGGKGCFYTNDINTDTSNLRVIGYMNGYTLQESDLSGFQINTKYVNENDSTYCEIESVEISLKTAETGIIIYNIHNASTFETLFNSYNIVTGETSHSVLSKNSFIIPLNTKCDESLYIEPLFFIPSIVINDNEFEKGNIGIEKSGNFDQSQFLYYCNVSTKNKALKNGYCFYERNIISGGLKDDEKHTLSTLFVNNGYGKITSTIKYKKDQNYYNMEDPQVDFSLSYFVPIHTIPNS